LSCLFLQLAGESLKQCQGIKSFKEADKLRRLKTRDADISQLQLLPEDKAVDFLVHQPEDQWLKRISARTQPRTLGELIVGFANAEGGVLAAGIHDGLVEGVTSSNRVNDWRQAAMDFTRPPVRHSFELLPCVNSDGARDEIVVIEIEASERVHTTAKGETFLRVGDENRKLGPVEAQELRYDKGESTYDGSAADGLGLDDLDEELVEQYLKSVRASTGREVALRARGLAVEKDGHVVPSVAGLMVLGREPQAHLPEAFMRVLRYQGSSRETGARANVIEDHKLEGPIPRQIEAARETVLATIPEAVRLQHGGRFAKSTIIPEFVWLEAIVNAATHRSYSIGGDHIRVELFDDRLEVESPGRLPGLVRLDNIRSSRFARNPRIARAMSELGYGRELGEGVNRMFEEMNRAGLPDPFYSERPGSVQVILLADPLAGRILDQLPPGSERFVEFLSSGDRVTTTQAMELLGASRPTVLGYLHDLRERDLIEHVGTSLKDPRGYWRLRRGSAERP
jgi:ATP-dependent DNA helicase RecG